MLSFPDGVTQKTEAAFLEGELLLKERRPLAAIKDALHSNLLVDVLYKHCVVSLLHIISQSKEK